jgi:hypothetical protein
LSQPPFEVLASGIVAFVASSCILLTSLPQWKKFEQEWLIDGLNGH